MADKKLEELQHKLDSFNKKKTNNNSTQKLDAFGFAVELAAGIIVGLVAGIMLDNYFNSKPLMLIICLLLGIAASIRVIIKILNQKNDNNE